MLLGKILKKGGEFQIQSTHNRENNASPVVKSHQNPFFSFFTGAFCWESFPSGYTFTLFRAYNSTRIGDHENLVVYG